VATIQQLETERIETDAASASGNTTHWSEVVEVLQKHYHSPDIEAARVLYSAVAAHDLAGQPVWPMAVAPPGSMKSELINALDGLPNVFLVDNFTPKTFLSGQIPDERSGIPARPASLLHRIGDSGYMLIPDFSTVLSMKSEDRGSVFASLRKIYDGKLTKEFGTSEKVEAWEGRITLVVGTTPEIDRHRSVNQSLGERFVMVRWKRAGIDAARKAILQDQKKAHADLKGAVRKLFANLPSGPVTIESCWQEQVVSLAELTVVARTTVHRNEKKQIAERPEPESPTRLAQQLCQLAKGSARIDGRTIVNESDIAIAKRAGFDSIPPRRLELLWAALENRTPTERTAVTRYDTEDLIELGLLEFANFPSRRCVDLYIGFTECAIDPFWWTSSERRIRCPECDQVMGAGESGDSSLRSSKKAPFGSS